MVKPRLEVRLDENHRRKLDSLLETTGLTPSTVVREAIDLMYEVKARERRRRAVEAIANMELEDLPDPEELSRQLDEAHHSPLP